MAVHPASPRNPESPFLAGLRAFREAIERRLEATWHAVDAAARHVEGFLELVGARAVEVIEAVGRATVGSWEFLCTVPGMVAEKAKIAALAILKVVYATFVIAPPWLFAQVRGVAAAALAFLVREVVPTSEFFVEVPLNLGGAVVRDLLIRVPHWALTEGPAGLVNAGRWLGLEVLVLGSALLSRLETMAGRLADAVLWTLSILEGGLHWILIDVIWAAGPFLMSLASAAFLYVVGFLHSLYVFLVSAGRWTWHTIIGLPGFVERTLEAAITLAGHIARATVQVLQVLAEALAQFAEVVGGALVNVYEAAAALVAKLPHAFLVLFSQMLPAFIDQAWALAVVTFVALFHDVPVFLVGALGDVASAVAAAGAALARAIGGLAAATFQWLTVDVPQAAWKLASAVYQALVIELPRAIWNSTVALLRWLFVDVPTAIWNALVSIIKVTVQLLFVEMPRLIASFARGAWETMVACWEEIAAWMRWIGNRLATVITWVLAIAISPFYLLWRLGGFSTHGPPRRPV